jgi:hypothetical protein
LSIFPPRPAPPRKLLLSSHGPHLAWRASIAACRQHTDLTCPAIAAIHHIVDAQPTYCRAAVDRCRHDDADFDHRYQQLLHHAEQARTAAGFANANLARQQAARYVKAAVRVGPEQNSATEEIRHRRAAVATVPLPGTGRWLSPPSLTPQLHKARPLGEYRQGGLPRSIDTRAACRSMFGRTTFTAQRLRAVRK